MKNFTFAMLIFVLVTMVVPVQALDRDSIWAAVSIYQTHEWTKAQVETAKIETNSNERINASNNCTAIIINAQNRGITPPDHCSSGAGVDINYRGANHFTSKQNAGPGNFLK